MVDRSRRGRAFGPGPAALAVVAVVAAVAAGVVPATRHSGHGQGYGTLPSWLPRRAVRVGRLVHASPTRPWVAVQGDTVAVEDRAGSALATVVGPAVPENGQFPVPRTTPCTFTVTLVGRRGSLPLAPGQFTILDELGRLHRPGVRAAGGGLPARLVAGRTVELTIHAVLPTGGGRLRWSLTAKPTVAWDFDVEID